MYPKLIYVFAVLLLVSPLGAQVDCASAAAVGEGAHAYDTSAGTPSGAAACDSDMENDTWFAYTASCSGDATVSTCGQTGTDSDSVLIVYDSCANANENCITSADDGCGDSGFMSEVTFAVTGGTTYMVQLGGSQGPGGTGGTGGTGTLEISLSTFRRGDANDSGEFDGVADALALLGYLFSSSEHTCIDALDSNDDGQIDITDAYYLLHYQFSSGEAPPAPGIGSCGVDPTDDALDCESYESCG